MRYVLIPVPSEYVLDVMRWVVLRSPDEEGNTSGRDLARVEALVSELDELERSILLMVAQSVWKDDSLALRDAAEDLEQSGQAIGDAIRSINRKAMWGTDVITVRQDTAVGVLGHHGRVSVISMWPETARLVRTAMRSTSVPGE